MKVSFKDKIYEIKSCTEDDIPFCVEKVLPYWTDIDIEERKELLKKLHSFKIMDGDTIQGFLYWRVLEQGDALGLAAWASRKPLYMMGMFYLKTMYPWYKYLLFLPHHNKIIPFKWVVEEASIKPAFIFGKPLAINLYYGKAVQSLNRYHFEVCDGD